MAFLVYQNKEPTLGFCFSTRTSQATWSITLTQWEVDWIETFVGLDTATKQLEKITTASNVPYHLDTNPVRIVVEQQQGNDCGPCTMLVAEAFAQNPENFM
jgi:hypothetical protein